MQFQVLQKPTEIICTAQLQCEESLPFICYDLANCLLFLSSPQLLCKQKQKTTFPPSPCHPLLRPYRPQILISSLAEESTHLSATHMDSLPFPLTTSVKSWNGRLFHFL